SVIYTFLRCIITPRHHPPSRRLITYMHTNVQHPHRRTLQRGDTHPPVPDDLLNQPRTRRIRRICRTRSHTARVHTARVHTARVVGARVVGARVVDHEPTLNSTTDTTRTPVRTHRRRISRGPVGTRPLSRRVAHHGRIESASHRVTVSTTSSSPCVCAVSPLA